MRRARPAFPVAVWGGVLVVLSAVALLFSPDTATTVLGFGGAASAVVAGATVLRSRWRGGEPATQLVPDLSVATVALAIGVSLAVVGAEVGGWLIGVGCGMTAAGTAGLVREWRAEHRAGTPGDAP